MKENHNYNEILSRLLPKEYVEEEAIDTGKYFLSKIARDRFVTKFLTVIFLALYFFCFV